MLRRGVGFIRAEWALLLIAGVTGVLRIPSLFEPLWYGDEAVYLTVAREMLRGDLLYVDIFDHKPPALYYLTAGFLAVFGQSVATFKVLALVFSIGALIAFYYLARHLLDKRAAILAVAFLSLLITPTWLEGNTVNSEILMIFPTCLGMLLGFQRRLFLAGCFFGLAFLFKIPAIFDFAAFSVFVALTVQKGAERRTLSDLALLIAGLLTPVAVTIAYFGAQGALAEYFDAAFLFSIDYTSSEQTTTGGHLLFSHGRLIVNGLPALMLVAWLAVRTARRWQARQLTAPSLFEFMLLWLLFSFYGVLLGGRPYEHYLIQAAPPFALLAAFVFTRSDFRRYFAAGALLVVVAITLDQGFELTKVDSNSESRRISTVDYYVDYNENFIEYALGDRRFDEYASFFDGWTAGNYRVTSLLRQDSGGAGESLFVYSDQTALYFRSGLHPAAKYLVFFHLAKDAARKQETSKEVAEARPRYIVAEDPPKREFPELERFLLENYRLISSEGVLRLYKRID